MGFFDHLLKSRTTSISNPEIPKLETVTAKDFFKQLAYTNQSPYKHFFNLGYLKPTISNNGGWLFKDFATQPNALFLGQMGSGKSSAMISTFTQHFLLNSNNGLFFVIDPLNQTPEGSDLFTLLHYPNVFHYFGEEDTILSWINLIYDEMIFRIESLKNKEIENISLFPQITIAIERFYTLPEMLNFDKDFQDPKTLAYKFLQIMKQGKNADIFVLAATSKASSIDLPLQLLETFHNRLVFKTSRVESCYLLGKSDAADLTNDHRGLCYFNDGLVQFTESLGHHEITPATELFYRPLDLNKITKSSESLHDLLSTILIKDLLKLNKK
jgi:hypothetical protein